LAHIERPNAALPRGQVRYLLHAGFLVFQHQSQFCAR
jgi:hypothetical protein